MNSLPAEAENIIEKIDALYEGIDFIQSSAKGVGLFISPTFYKLIYFPFTVKEKTLISDTFETRDLFYQAYLEVDYYVLFLSQKIVHLYKGKGESLTEVKDKDLPMEYQESYEYSKPTIENPSSSSLKNFEKDKSILENIRLETFFRETDKTIKKHVKDVPLILTGTVKNVSSFEAVIKNRNNIIGKVLGNYEYESIDKLEKKSWEKILDFIQKKTAAFIEQLDKAIGEKRASIGIRETWRAAAEGKGLLLLVEKDYHCNGFLGKDKFNLFLNPPEEQHKIITDAVDKVIEIVVRKKGKLVFVDNRKLENYGRIALINRY